MRARARKLHPQEVTAVATTAVVYCNCDYLDIYNALTVSLTATIYVCDCLAILSLVPRLLCLGTRVSYTVLCIAISVTTEAASI